MASKVMGGSKDVSKNPSKPKSKMGVAGVHTDADLVQQQIYGLSVVLDDLKWSLDEAQKVSFDHEDRLRLVEHTEIVHSAILKTTVVTPMEYEEIWNHILGVVGTVQ